MLNSIKARVQDFATDETAPTTMEYAIIAAILVTTVVGAIGFMFGRVRDAFNNAGNAMP